VLLEKIAIEVAGTYVKEAKESWKTTVEEFIIEDARVEPTVTLVANDNWMEFTVRYVVDYKKRRTTKDVFFRRLLEDIDHTEGKVALASATFELVGVPPITVTSNQREQ
jgi:hypothetical protein